MKVGADQQAQMLNTILVLLKVTADMPLGYILVLWHVILHSGPHDYIHPKRLVLVIMSCVAGFSKAHSMCLV